MPTRSPSEELTLLVRMLLLEDANLAAEVGPRVYGSMAEDSDAGNLLQSGPAVFFEIVAGNATWHGHIAYPTLDVYAYSKRSQGEALKVYDLLFEAMHQQRLARTGVNMAGLIREIQRPSAGWNAKVGGWFALGRWSAGVAS